MSENQDWNTDFLWSLIKGLFLVLFGFIALIIYIPFRGTINEYLSDKKYSKEELEKMTATRSLIYEQDWDKIENGIHLRTGMAYDENFKLVRATCTSCHSSKLIIQNRADREGWKHMIVWMQETQGLPDLGTSEPKILDYLAKHYAPKKTGRRPNLDISALDWYILTVE